MSDEDEVAYEGAIQPYVFRLFTDIASCRLFTQLWHHIWLPDFVEVVLGRFDRKNFLCQKHELNANKYFSKHFFVNRGVKLYEIMLFIL